MIKTHKDSSLEVWSSKYIDDIDECRNEYDKDAEVVQIELGCDDNYIVEVVRKAAAHV